MSDSEDDFPGAPTNLEFWSLEIPAGKVVEAKIKDLPGVFEIVHVTGCALGEHATPDRHVLKAIVTNPEGKSREVALGTLARDRTDQFALDFGINSTTGFRHTGKSTVYLSGYLTRSFATEDEFGSDDEYGMETDEDEDDDSDEAPQAIGLNVNGVPQGKAAAADSDSDDELGDSESSDEEEDEEDDSSTEEGESEDNEDEQGDEYDRRLGAKSFIDVSASESGDEEEEGDEAEDDESDNPLHIDPHDAVAVVQYDEAAAAGPEAKKAEANSSEEETGEGEDEGEDEDDSEDESEEESEDYDEDEESEDEKAPPPAAAGKRPLQQPMTPQVQPKRQKGQDGVKAPPASAPAKGPQAKTSGGPVEQKFLQEIVSQLRKSGSPLPLGQLSTKVKRPAGVPKYKAFLLQHTDLISVDAKDNVTLAK